MTEHNAPLTKITRLKHARNQKGDQENDATRGIVDLNNSALFEGILLRRSCAALLDFLIVSIISTVLWLANCVTSIGTFGLISLPTFVLAPIVIHILMCTYFLAGSQGASLGMRAFGIRAVTIDGRKIDHVQAFLTTAMFFATVSIFFPVLMAGLFTHRSRLLHDIVVGTLIVRSNRS